jgi:hypothetical protein
MTASDISQVIKDHADQIMAIPGVVGIASGLTNDAIPFILVLVIKDTAELRKHIPEQLEGHPVIIDETGEIHALSDEEE